MTKILSRKASVTMETYVNFADVALLQFWKIEKSFVLLKLIVVFLVSLHIRSMCETICDAQAGLCTVDLKQ